jgi:hypothetical protein
VAPSGVLLSVPPNGPCHLSHDAIVNIGRVEAGGRRGERAVIEDESDGLDDERPVNEQARRLKSSSLLWFISSRPYVPMADIRRRFGLVTETGAFLSDEEGSVHIGLPRQAAETLLDLKRRQKVGLQYDLEYATRIVVGAYPIRIRLAPPAPVGRLPQQAAPAPVSAPMEPTDEGVPDEAPPPAVPLATSKSPTAGQRRRRRR